MPVRQVYCTFCKQTFHSSDADPCSLCGNSGGLVDPMSPEALAQLAAKKHEPAPLDQQVGDAFDTALMSWRLLKLTAAGIVALALGVLLLGCPGLHDDPNRLSVRDVLVAIGPIIVGIVLLSWTFMGWRNLQQSGSQTKQTPTLSSHPNSEPGHTEQ